MTHSQRQMSRQVPRLLQAVGLGAAALALGGFVPAAHAASLFVTDADNNFGTLDLATGQVSYIGTITDNANYDPSYNPNGDPVGGLSFAPDGTLYGTTLDSTSPYGSPTGSDLVTIKPTTAATTDLGNIGESVDTALVLPDGEVLANDVNNEDTYRISVGTPPTVTQTVNSGAYLGGGLTFGPNGLLYAENFNDPDDAEDQLYSLDPGTLAGTFIGTIEDAAHGPYSVAAAAYDGTTLYGLTVDDDIITINTSSGAATNVGTYSLAGFPTTGLNDYLEAATFGSPASPAPEPSQAGILALLGVGLGGLILRAKRRQTST